MQARGTEPYPQSCLSPRSHHSGAKQRDREHARSQDMPGGPPPSRPTQAAACPACPRVRQIRIVGPAQIVSESVCLWLAAPICVFRVSGPRISVPSPGLGRAAGIEFFIWSEGCPTRQEARPCCGTSRAAHGERAWLHLQEKAALRDDSTFMLGGGRAGEVIERLARGDLSIPRASLGLDWGLRPGGDGDDPVDGRSPAPPLTISIKFCPHRPTPGPGQAG